METDIHKKILAEHQELSSLPQTLSEVLKVSRNADSSAKEMSTVLLRDPAMTAKVLRLANSPFFGAGREISSVTQAVMTLGMRAVTALSLSASVYDLTSKWETSIDRVRFWRHSLSVAVASRGIAEAVRYRCPEESFVAGLLHDIGLLVMEKSFPEKFARIWRQAESGENLHELEENVWGTNHARIGQFLLEQWGIPDVICSAVGRHHIEVPSDNNDPDWQLTQIVALGNELAHYTVVKARPHHSMDVDRRENIRSNLKLDSEKLAQVRDRLLEQTVREAEFLEIEIGNTEELLADANRMLYEQFITLEKVLRENRSMQREIAKAQLEKSALETLKTITATFNHYINNAVGTILGRAQLVQRDIDLGRLADTSGNSIQSMEVIVNGVKTIRLVMEELTNLSAFKTTVYYDDTYIVDIEKKIKERVESIENVTPTAG